MEIRMYRIIRMILLARFCLELKDHPLFLIPYPMFLKMRPLPLSLLYLQNQPVYAIRGIHFQIALPALVSIEKVKAAYNPNKNNNNEQHGEVFVLSHIQHLYWKAIAHLQL